MSAGPPEPSPLLPVVGQPPPRIQPVSRPQRLLIRLTRAALFIAAIWLIAASQRRLEGDTPATDVSFDEAVQLFPTAARLGPRDAARHGRIVLDAAGTPLGVVLKTSPHTDQIIGYSGPSNLLLGLDNDGDIRDVRFLWSRDTAEHVEQVRRHRPFWEQFPGWNPTLGEQRRIEAVSGSTLTSLGMAESIATRLSGRTSSLRFPEAITLAEVQSMFPTAAELLPDAAGRIAVNDAAGGRLGEVIRTSPGAENVRGYSGPTEALIAINSARDKVLAVRLRSSYDTPEYVDRVRTDAEFLNSLAGRSLHDWATLDFAAAGIEGVSGATQTSFGVAEGVRRRLKSEVDRDSAPESTSSPWKLRDLGLVAIIVGGLVVMFVPGFSERRVRILWQIILVAAFGLWLGDMLSIALVAGWSRYGPAWSTAPGLVALAAIAFLIPWTTRRQVYCHALCPHGAVQEWLGRSRRLHVRLPRRVNRALGTVPGILLAASLAIALLRPAFNLARIEPFDAWVLGPVAAASFTIGLLGLIASIFIPQAYCRFGCPTGALLKLVRSHGLAERWKPQDVCAAAAVLLAAFWVYRPDRAEALAPAQASAGPAVLSGHAFGTTWTVKVRDPLASTTALHDDIADELEQLESRLSHWRPNSETSQFNASQTTLEMECSSELAALVERARALSAATRGEFDITVGPLVNAWGYGPSGPQASPPDEQTLHRLLQSTGWTKLEVDLSVPSLRKHDPALQIDLGSLLHGYAVDHVHELLRERGLNEFLVEIGGELRAAGRWQVALDAAAGPWATPTFVLDNRAVSTSGVYRSGAGGNEKHIISPLTGRPGATHWRAAAVLAPTCTEADAWDTALLVVTEAPEIARAQGLAVQLIPADGMPAVTVGSWP